MELKSKPELIHISTSKEMIISSCAKLENSNKTLEDIYNTVFYRIGDLCETSGPLGVVVYTYEMFRNQVEKASSSLYQRVGTDKYIALFGTNSYEWTVAFWSILKSGNKPCLVNVLQPVSAIKSFLRTMECSYILSVGSSLNEMEDSGVEEVSYSSLFETDVVVECSVFGNRIALTTSGTTMIEKICVYSGETITNQMLNATDIIKETPEIMEGYNGKVKMLMALPLFHIFGLEASYFWYLLYGAVFVFPPSVAPSVIFSTVKRHEITHIFYVPLFWQSIEKAVRKEIASADAKTRKEIEAALEKSLELQNSNPVKGMAFAQKAFRPIRNKLLGDSVKFCISGGSDIDCETMSLINALGYPLYNGYGMTEIGIVSANFAKTMDRRLNHTIGCMFSSIEYKVSEEQHLLVSGDSVCREFIIGGERIFRDKWFDTGDIVSVNQFGDVEIKGRASDLVIGADGENLNPNLAEKAFSLTNALNFSVIGDESNSNLIMIVQISENMLNRKFAELEKEVDEGMKNLPASYNIKKVLYTTDSLFGEKEIKISRKKLQKRIEEGTITFVSFNKEASSKSVDSEISLRLKKIFASVLGIKAEDIRGDEHFMNDLGGTSLEYYDIICEVEEVFEIKIELEEKNFAYTLNDLERVIKGKINL